LNLEGTLIENFSSNHLFRFPKYLDEIGAVQKKKKDEEGNDKTIIILKAPLKFEPIKPKKLRK